MVQEDPLPTAVADRFFLEPPNPARMGRHLERYYELFDISAASDQQWRQAVVHLARRLFGAERVLGGPPQPEAPGQNR